MFRLCFQRLTKLAGSYQYYPQHTICSGVGIRKPLYLVFFALTRTYEQKYQKCVLQRIFSPRDYGALSVKNEKVQMGGE